MPSPSLLGTATDASRARTTLAASGGKPYE
jgi:hypothetical protein